MRVATIRNSSVQFWHSTTNSPSSWGREEKKYVELSSFYKGEGEGKSISLVRRCCYFPCGEEEGEEGKKAARSSSVALVFFFKGEEGGGEGGGRGCLVGPSLAFRRCPKKRGGGGGERKQVKGGSLIICLNLVFKIREKGGKAYIEGRKSVFPHHAAACLCCCKSNCLEEKEKKRKKEGIASERTAGANVPTIFFCVEGGGGKGKER